MQIASHWQVRTQIWVGSLIGKIENKNKTLKWKWVRKLTSNSQYESLFDLCRWRRQRFLFDLYRRRPLSSKICSRRHPHPLQPTTSPISTDDLSHLPTTTDDMSHLDDLSHLFDRRRPWEENPNTISTKRSLCPSLDEETGFNWEDKGVLIWEGRHCTQFGAWLGLDWLIWVHSLEQWVSKFFFYFFSFLCNKIFN